MSLRGIQLRPYQKQFVDSLRGEFRKGLRSVLGVMPTGGGKCLGRGTPVLMHDGSVKPVEEVRVGDVLMGPDSKPRNVLSVCSGRESLYRITPVKGDSYVVNESHILSLKRTSESSNPKYPCERRAGEIENIEVRDYLKKSKSWKHIRKGWRTGVEFQPKEISPWLPAYILGAWLGDGDSRCPAITSIDTEVIQEFEAFAASRALKLVKRISKDRTPGYFLTNPTARRGRGHFGNPVLNALRQLNLLQNKHVPLLYRANSREIRLEVLAGLIDTDGHYTHKGYDLVFKIKRLAEDTAFLARSLGLSAYVKPCRKTCHNNGVTGDYFRIGISGDVDMIPVRCQRKEATPRLQKKSVLVTGIKVEPIGEGDYFGFELDGDRLFLLGDFTVTHNTICFSTICQSAAERGNRVAILAHRAELVMQASKSLEMLGLQHGIISPSFYATNDPIQVASVQTLARRITNHNYLKHNRFDLIIIDECHHSVAGQWSKILQAFPEARVLGVTATPTRLDGQGLCAAFQSMIEGPTTEQLIRDGFLSPFKIYAPPMEVSLEGAKISGGDYQRKDLSQRMNKPRITGCAVEHYRRIAPGKAAIAFCVSVEHAQQVAREFQQAGFTAVSLDGTMSDADRRLAIEGLAGGRVKVLTSCEIVSEGFDIPHVEVAILLRPTRSLGMYLQQVGRALRPSPGKTHATILDHVGNVVEHGLPDEPREWTLAAADLKRSDGEREATFTVQTCPKCFMAHRPAFKCPSCGHEYVANERTIEQVEGELKEVSVEEIRREREARRREVGSARTMEDLLRVAKERGYKAAWAEYVFNSRRGRRA